MTVAKSWVVTAGSPAQAAAMVGRAQASGGLWRQPTLSGNIQAPRPFSGRDQAGIGTCFTLPMLFLAGAAGLALGLVGGWFLASAMQVGTALAPAAGAAFKAAPLALL